MSIQWTRLLKQAYRRQPLISFVVTAGVVDVLIGGLEGRGFLLAFSLGAVSATIAFHWWNTQRKRRGNFPQTPIHYLPEQSSRPRLPLLGLSHKDPPPRNR